MATKTKTKPTTPIAPATPPARPTRFTPLLTGFDYPEPLIARFAATLFPPFMATVDMQQFTRMLLGSCSLSMDEKNRIIDALPTLSQYQCDALQEVWADEAKEFQRLVKTEWHIVSALGAKAWTEACLLATERGAGYNAAEEKQALTAMLQAKYNTPPKRAWLQKAVAENHPLNESVYGAALPHAAVLELPNDF